MQLYSKRQIFGLQNNIICAIIWVYQDQSFIQTNSICLIL